MQHYPVWIDTGYSTESVAKIKSWDWGVGEKKKVYRRCLRSTGREDLACLVTTH